MAHYMILKPGDITRKCDQFWSEERKQWLHFKEVKPCPPNKIVRRPLLSKRKEHSVEERRVMRMLTSDKRKPYDQ